jgi:hypothetical protein
MSKDKLIERLNAIPPTEVRKEQLLALTKYLFDTGLELVPASTGKSVDYQGGNYAGGLIDHILSVHDRLLAYASDKGVPQPTPLSLLLVSIAHAAFKVTDGFGHAYYETKTSKTGKALKCPYGKVKAYAELPSFAANLITARAFINPLLPDEIQALAFSDYASVEQSAEDTYIKLYPLTLYLRTAYTLSVGYVEKRAGGESDEE